MCDCVCVCVCKCWCCGVIMFYSVSSLLSIWVSAFFFVLLVCKLQDTYITWMSFFFSIKQLHPSFCFSILFLSLSSLHEFSLNPPPPTPFFSLKWLATEAPVRAVRPAFGAEPAHDACSLVLATASLRTGWSRAAFGAGGTLTNLNSYFKAVDSWRGI